MRRHLKSIHQGKSIESWIPLKWKVGDEWWVCLIDGCLFWIGGWGDQSGRPNSMPPDVVCTCGSMSSCGVEMWVPKPGLAFYGWHGYKGTRHMPTTSVPDGLGCLNRGRGAFHQWTSIPSLKLGRSSPEISGDGPVHPRVALPRFGDRWDLFLKALQRVRYFHTSLLRGLFSKYFFVVFSNIFFFWRAIPGKPNSNWCSTPKNWIWRRSCNHTWTGENIHIFQKNYSFYSGIFRRCFQPVWPRIRKQGMYH